VQVDAMSAPQPLATMADHARALGDSGFSGVVLTEGGRSVFTAAAVVATAAPELHLATGVAVAFARSPMVSAQAAWELQEATGGRFRLGLGTQVRTHVVRRYGAEFQHPGARLADYVSAVKACFAAFRGAPLRHAGPFYELSFMSAQWNPGPIECADPPVDVAAVNPWMLRMAGAVSDGVHIHPLGGWPGYLQRTALPNIAEGARRAGRDPGDVALIVPVTTIAGDSDEEIDAARRRARQMLSFYGSTPNYAFIWDEAGFEGTTERLRARQKAGDLEGMAAEITDEHLAVACIESSWDDLPARLVDTYRGLATRLVLYDAATAPRERLARYGEVARAASGG
jgi:probable F420-dependent oxidoreductase